MSYFTLHVAGRVLRFVDCLPDGEAKCARACQDIPGARYELMQGALPKPSDIEQAAQEFRQKYTEKLADAFLADHGYTDSGVFPRLKVVS